MASGQLHLVPVPIAEGDPALTLPASTLLAARSCSRFLAENAKSARAALKAMGHPSPIADLTIIEIGHEPDPALFDEWLAPVAAGVDTAIISESGCPAVADPGAGLVRAAQEKGIAVIPHPGPCSILLTLMASGMNGQRFRFLGYLPVHEDERRKAILDLQNESCKTGETELFIETPYRNNRLLQALAETLAPAARITAATDLTGPSESITTLTAADWRKKGFELPKLPTVFAVMAQSAAGVTGKKPARALQAKPRSKH